MRSAQLRRTGARPALSALALATGLGVIVTAPAPAASGADHPVDRRFTDSRITESSGIARSTYASDVLFTHNDSGDSNRVFAVGKSGATQAVLTLKDAAARDWEDISTGPNHTLWVGDIGDNSKRRTSIQVYRFTEPATLKTSTIPTTRYDLAYPDGKHNAEGLLVHPKTGRVYVVTKSDNGGAVYAAPSTLSTSAVNRMTRVASAPKTISAATFSPDGSTIVLSSYTKAYIYKSFGGSARTVSKPSGESAEITAGGAMLTGTEGKQSAVYRISQY
jgi:hypothetical protein